jgi:hypothetical protein
MRFRTNTIGAIAQTFCQTLPYLTSVSSHPSKDNHAIWHVEHPISNKNHV